MIIYDIKPTPTTAYGLFEDWKNYTTARLVRTVGKKVVVK